MASELPAHCRKDAIAEVSLTARVEAIIEGGREHVSWTPSSTAVSAVHRPSPELETRPARSARSGERQSAPAVRSRSHEAITLPRRQTSEISGSGRS